MPTSKLRAPENFSGLSLDGRDINVGADGSCQADHRDIATLRSHGFTDWHDAPGAGGDIETMTKTQLVEEVARRARDEAGKMDIERLRDALRGAPPADDAAPTEAELAEAETRLEGEGNVVTEERINAMTRAELFAYLKSRGVAIGPATKDVGLRAAALDTLRKQAA